jgi:hypothetical protein
VSHHLNPLRMDHLKIYTSFNNELLGITILPLHEMHDNGPSSLPTLMHPRRIGILSSQQPRMPFLRGCIKVGGEGDTLPCISWSEKMITPSNSYMDEVNILKWSILKGLRWCDTHYYLGGAIIIGVHPSWRILWINRGPLVFQVGQQWHTFP